MNVFHWLQLIYLVLRIKMKLIWDALFDHWQNLTYIDISSFNCDYENPHDYYNEFPNFGTIKIGNGCINKVEGSIPSKWNIISQ